MEPRSNLSCKSFRKSEHKLEGNIHIISVKEASRGPVPDP